MTMTDKNLRHHSCTHARWPGWVPESALNYIIHTEAGLSIRALAREKGCHPSTVLRQIRRIEARRDDPLVDEALRKLGMQAVSKESCRKMRNVFHGIDIKHEIIPLLKVLSAHGRVLAIADHLEKAVIVGTGQSDKLKPLPVVRDVALLLALRGWIERRSEGRVHQYKISQAGRIALGQLVARYENAALRNAVGFAEAKGGVLARNNASDFAATAANAESPVFMLARRRDRSGVPFLTQDLVDAAERLRQDFVLSEMQNAEQATARVKDALDDLGPGLADVVLRCCCRLEGLEAAERDMGWSARSGKVVLRIALQRLRRHYAASGCGAEMIG